MINEIIQPWVDRHELVLHELLSETTIPAARIRDALHYALFPGGKRLRPVLVYLTGELLSVDCRHLDLIAAAIELTHCYSLIHDDLPAMDNDDFRRGKASCHRAFDEATAILAGDGLQALAIDILATHLPRTLPACQAIAVIQELVRASGPAGMVSGQSLDLSELSQPHTTASQLREIHQLKTGMLIAACINMVLNAGQPQPDAREITALQQYSAHLGLVFQMQDDYLDRYGNEALGKGRQSDLANQKTTFATLFEPQALLDLIHRHYQASCQALTLFGTKAQHLLLLTKNLQNRTSTA